MHDIYSITNIVTGKVYVGQTTEGYRNRWRRHRWDLNHNKHGNGYLQAAWNKYGADNFRFEVIVSDIPVDCLNIAECAWIQHYTRMTMSYNLTTGGCDHYQRSTATCLKLSAANKGRKPAPQTIAASIAARIGRKLSPEHRAKIGAKAKGQAGPMLGKHHSEETKRKLSVANKGQIPWTKGKPGPMLGKHHTAVTCKRLGDAARGRPQSVATRAKRSASLRQHYAQKCLVENN